MAQLHITHWLRGGGGGVYWKLTSCQFNTGSANTVHEVWAWKLLGRPQMWGEYVSMLKVRRHNEPELSFVGFCFTWVCSCILCMHIHVTVNGPFLFIRGRWTHLAGALQTGQLIPYMLLSVFENSTSTLSMQRVVHFCIFMTGGGGWRLMSKFKAMVYQGPPKIPNAFSF